MKWNGETEEEAVNKSFKLSENEAQNRLERFIEE